jgi:hypothetical protein
MTFREYYKEPIKESPDLVYSPKTKKPINWYTAGSITFGTLWGIKDLSPFFIKSIPKRGRDTSHNDLLDIFIYLLQYEYNEFVEEYGPKIDLQAFEKHLKNKLIWNKDMSIDPKAAGRIANEVINSQHIMKHLQKDNYAYHFDVTRESRTKDGSGKTDIEKQLSARLRTVLYKNAGRVWPKHSTISFWLTQDQLTPQILDDAFNNLNIKDKQNYFIDVVNVEEVDKEETKNKVLPSYIDYKKRSAPEKKDISDEQRKKAQEFMAKQHGQIGAQKAKFGSDIPEVGAKKYAKQMPLDVRQQVQTSESKKNI